MTPSMSASREGIVYSPDRETFLDTLKAYADAERLIRYIETIERPETE